MMCFRNFTRQYVPRIVLSIAAISFAGALGRQVAALSQSTNIAVVPGPSGAGHGGTWPTSYSGMTFTNVPLSSISASTLASFDTVALVQVCDVNTALSSQQKVDLLSFVSNGGKLIITDSECSVASYPPVPDYSWLPFPFTSSNPGAQGAPAQCGDLSVIEENTLSCSSASQPCFVDTCDIAVNTDGVGDMNVMITGTAQWCIDMAGRNVLGSAGPVQAYQHLGQGLIIYNGLDMDYVPGNANLTKTWELDLRQSFNPASGLFCGQPGAGRIDLAPVSAPANPPGTTHTVTATAFTAAGSPAAGVSVMFTINGPNATSCTSVTNSSGVATCSYTGGTSLGTDIITAGATIGGQHVTSNFATKAWGPIKLEPVDDSNPVGASHTVTAMVVDLTKPNPPPPLAGISVTFEVVGVHPNQTTKTTNASGQATFTYTGTRPGLDAIKATAVISGQEFPSNFASKRWLALLLEPKTATNPVGTQHTVTATAYDATGAPRAGVAVDFKITGANPNTCRQTTNSSGKASCTYTGANTGSDVIVASFVDPAGGQTITSDPAFKTWTAPPVELRIGDGVLVPGQQRAGVPILLDNPQTIVRGLQFSLIDSPNEVQLSAAPAAQTTARTNGFAADANQVSNEMRVVALSTGSARIAAGNGQILTLLVDDVSPMCTPGSTIDLQLTDSQIADDGNNPVPHTNVDGSLRCGCAGDSDFDGDVDIFDALRCVDFVIHRLTPTDAERAAADVDHDADIDVFDCLATVDIAIKRRGCIGSVPGVCDVFPDGQCVTVGASCSGGRCFNDSGGCVCR